MSAYFADACLFFALLNPRDEAHAAAVSFNAQSRRPIVTTAWVLTEIADGLAATASRELFFRLLRHLREDRRAVVVPSTPELFERGVTLYSKRPDKTWSLTD